MTKGKVNKIFDGDTFQVNGGKVIRLANVRAPETGTKGASKAKTDLGNLVLGKTVSYNTVGKSYGRDVAQVKIAGKSVNQSMRNKGYRNKGK